MDVVREMANSVTSYLVFTVDHVVLHAEGKVSMLEPQVWRKVFLHSMYEKPVSSKMVLMQRSAMAIKSKITILAQDIVTGQTLQLRPGGKSLV